MNGQHHICQHHDFKVLYIKNIDDLQDDKQVVKVKQTLKYICRKYGSVDRITLKKNNHFIKYTAFIYFSEIDDAQQFRILDELPKTFKNKELKHIKVHWKLSRSESQELGLTKKGRFSQASLVLLGLKADVTEQQLQEVFGSYCELFSVRIQSNPVYCTQQGWINLDSKMLADYILDNKYDDQIKELFQGDKVNITIQKKTGELVQQDHQNNKIQDQCQHKQHDASKNSNQNQQVVINPQQKQEQKNMGFIKVQYKYRNILNKKMKQRSIKIQEFMARLILWNMFV